MKLTKQGVRDLGGNHPSRPPARRLPRCWHIWESEREYDCLGGYFQWVQRCAVCRESRY